MLSSIHLERKFSGQFGHIFWESKCDKLSDFKPPLVYHHLPSRLMPGLATFYDSHLRVARLKGQRVKELASSIGQSKTNTSLFCNAFTHMHEILSAHFCNLAMGFVVFLKYNLHL